jgi:hypothetical protein
MDRKDLLIVRVSVFSLIALAVILILENLK